MARTRQTARMSTGFGPALQFNNPLGNYQAAYQTTGFGSGMSMNIGDRKHLVVSVVSFVNGMIQSPATLFLKVLFSLTVLPDFAYFTIRFRDRCEQSLFACVDVVGGLHPSVLQVK